MERVRCARAVCRRIGERIDNLHLLDDRAWPSMRDDERQCTFMFRADVNEVGELRFAAEGITTVTTWSPIRDEALKKPPPTGYPRSDLKPVRTSSEKSCGCSQAAKWPPLGSSLKWMRLR